MSRSRGYKRELSVRDHLAKQDWLVVRAPGSFGAADLIALKPGHRPLFVQVKSDRLSPYAHFGPADRAALLKLAEFGGGDAWLVWHPPYGELRWIHPREWPGERKAAA